MEAISNKPTNRSHEGHDPRTLAVGELGYLTALKINSTVQVGNLLKNGVALR